MRDYLHFLEAYHPWALRVWFFGFGACVGSFLNVCILRLPLGRSIVTPRSQCVCGKPIAWYDNIPILSWFILRGRARCCGQRFSIRYSIIEAVTAGVFLWLWLALPHAQAFAGMVFFSLLLLGGMIDLDHMVLPDVTTLGGMFVGLAFSLAWPQIHGLPGGGWHWLVARQSALLALAGIVTGAGVVYWIGEAGNFFLRRPSMGYGDMLLMGCVGAFGGWRGTLAALFGGALLACLVILPMTLFARARPDNPEAEPPAGEAGDTSEVEPSPLGRRYFELDYLLVLAAMLGAFIWMWHTRVAVFSWPGAIFLGLASVLAVWKRKRLSWHEPWLLGVMVGGIILSSVFPRMHGLILEGAWLADAVPGVVMSALGVVVGAGIALWLLEFGNWIQLYFFSSPAADTPVEDYNQIWGEGYLLVFGGIGAFCGWRAAVMAAAVFAPVGAVKAVWRHFSSVRATSKVQPGMTEDAALPLPADSGPATWRPGQEIPFGPWLAMAGFLYYAWPWLHLNWDRNLDILRALLMGEMPPGS